MLLILSFLAPPPPPKGSWYLSSASGSSAKEDYNQARINGSAFVDIDQLSDTTSNLPHMLPPTNQFNTQVGQVYIIVNYCITGFI